MLCNPSMYLYIFDYFLLSFPSSTESVSVRECISLHCSALLRVCVVLCCALLCVCYTCTVLCTVRCALCIVYVCFVFLLARSIRGTFQTIQTYLWHYQNDYLVRLVKQHESKLGLGKEIEEERHLGENSKRRRRHTTNQQASSSSKQSSKQASSQSNE